MEADKETTVGSDGTAHALSNSGINDFAISPLRYWARHIDPHREIPTDTPAKAFGRALHAAVLQPDKFKALFCEQFTPPEGTLTTITDLRSWISDKGGKPKGSAKSNLIEQVQKIDAGVAIYDILAEQFKDQNIGKVVFSSADWARINSAAQALRDEPLLAEILADPNGEAEKRYLVNWNGIDLKAYMDWVTPDWTVDLKTISTGQHGERSFDREITTAIWYRGYYRQAYFYSLVRSIMSGGNPQTGPRFLFAFVESEPPHEVRLREMRPKEFGEVNMLWLRARNEVNRCIDLYREYLKEFGAGEKPWRYACQIEALQDFEIPALGYGG